MGGSLSFSVQAGFVLGLGRERAVNEFEATFETGDGLLERGLAARRRAMLALSVVPAWVGCAGLFF